jgi:hypothetical protein
MIEEYNNSDVSFKFSVYDQKLHLMVNIDNGSIRGLPINFKIADVFYLTSPKLVRGKQHKSLNFVIMDEFEKSFSYSIIEENNEFNQAKLFNNYLDIIISISRNKRVRFLYLGNITNTASPIWDFLEINNFNFKEKRLDKYGKMLIVNIVPFYTNEDFSEMFSSNLTTMGIDESDMLPTNSLIDEDITFNIKDKDVTGIYNNNSIFYIKDNKVVYENLDANTLNEFMNEAKREFNIVKKVNNNINQEQVMDIIKKSINLNRKLDSNDFNFNSEKEIITKRTRPFYNVSNIVFDKPFINLKKEELGRSLPKINTLTFNSLNTYLQYVGIFGINNDTGTKK